MEELLQNEFFRFFVFLIGTIFIAVISNFVLKIFLRKIVKKTKSKLDDIILDIVTKPFFVLIALIGLYFALRQLSFLVPYVLWVDNLFFVFLVFLIASVISKVFGLLISHGIKVHERFKKTPKIVNKMVAITVYIIAFLIIFAYFKIEITPLIATLGIGGLAVGLALQSTLSDFFAGLVILTDKQINVGDFIEIKDEVSGYVEDIGWRSTRVRTLFNILVFIPNAKVAQSIVINDSLPEPEISIIVECGVAYESNLNIVEKVTLDVARKIQKTIDGAVDDFEPIIRFKEFGPSNINFKVILRVKKPVEKYIVTHEFIKALKERFDQERIEISWPIRKVYNM